MLVREEKEVDTLLLFTSHNPNVTVDVQNCHLQTYEGGIGRSNYINRLVTVLGYSDTVVVGVKVYFDLESTDVRTSDTSLGD